MDKKRSIPTITRADFDAILAEIDTTRHTGLRDRAALLLMWHTGARVGEVVNATRGAIDRNAHEFHIPAEGKRGACVVALPRGSAWEELDAALQAWERVRPADSPYYFTTTWGAGGKMHTNSIARTLETCADRAGITTSDGGTVHPHVLRHTFATDALRRGWTMPDVARQLGHSSPSVTARHYLHADTARLHELQERDAETRS